MNEYMVSCSCPKIAAGGRMADYEMHNPECGAARVLRGGRIIVNEPELKLLVIDMGDCCVVKVEKGQLPADTVSMALPDEIRDLLGYVDDLKSGYCMVSDKTFTELRQAIDNAEGSKPVPRIERRDNRESPWAYQLFDASGANENYLTSVEYNALSQLAGKPLPVWSGGTWTRMPRTSEYMDDPLEGTGIKVWRYER